MRHCQNRMIEKHPGTGKAHDFPDFCPHFRAIAVCFAVRAERFALHKWAVIGAVYGIGQNFPAVWAQIRPMMLLLAIKLDHLGNNPLFLFPLIRNGFHGDRPLCI